MVRDIAEFEYIQGRENKTADSLSEKILFQLVSQAVQVLYVMFKN